MNEYLVPANSKNSALILGLFKPVDLIILGIGLCVTVALLFILQNPPFLELVFAICPLCLSVLLVFPVPNYHNVLQLIINIFSFFTGVKYYAWKGWCVKDEQRDK